MASEDIPHKKKSCAAVLVNMYKETKIDLSVIKWKYTANEQYKAEDEHWFYRELLEEVLKLADGEGVKDNLTPVVESLTALAKSWKEHYKQ